MYSTAVWASFAAYPLFCVFFGADLLHGNYMQGFYTAFMFTFIYAFLGTFFAGAYYYWGGRATNLTIGGQWYQMKARAYMHAQTYMFVTVSALLWAWYAQYRPTNGATFSTIALPIDQNIIGYIDWNCNLVAIIIMLPTMIHAFSGLQSARRMLTSVPSIKQD